MPGFQEWVNRIFESEGGFVNNPADNGGPTNYGITIGTLSDWLGRPCSVSDVKNLLRSDAELIYKKWYWNMVKAEEMPFLLAFIVADTAVHAGVKQAIRWLQKALGVKVDGVIGLQTLTAVKKANITNVIVDMTVEKLLFLAKHEDFSTFGRGWYRRVTLKVVEAIQLSKGGSDD